jgi:GT2 family glycosyltransferase
MVTAELSIIIVNWNGASFLPQCLQSIVDNPATVSFEIIVVDNESIDGSAEWLRSSASLEIMGDTPFKLLEPRANLGFGRAVNLAISLTSSPNVLILNADTRILPGSIDLLMETLNSQANIGMVGPKLRYEDGRLQDSVSRQPDTPFSILVDYLHLHWLIPKSLRSSWLLGVHWSHDERRPVPVIAGAAMMCKREMVDDIGGFDPLIHMYAEDLEWCVRARRAGWKIYFEPEAEIIHIREKSSEQRWSVDEKTLIQENAMIYYENKSFSRTLNLINGITRVIVMLTHLTRWKITRRNTSLISALIRLRIANCKHLLFASRHSIQIEPKHG